MQNENLVKRKSTFKPELVQFCECDCGRLTSGCKTKGSNYAKFAPGHQSRAKFTHLIGQKFGKLTILKFVEKQDRITAGAGTAFWCKCECGKELEIRRNSLLNKTRPTQSCGCYAIEVNSGPKPNRRIFPDNLGLGQYYSQYKSSAKRRNLSFELSPEEAYQLFSSNCFYCETPPGKLIWGEDSNGNKFPLTIAHGIDRVDNNKGYIKNNVVPCCNQCNLAKLDYTFSQFKQWIKKVHNHLYKEIKCQQ